LIQEEDDFKKILIQEKNLQNQKIRTEFKISISNFEKIGDAIDKTMNFKSELENLFM
jgi:hypothetical protein